MLYNIVDLDFYDSYNLLDRFYIPSTFIKNLTGDKEYKELHSHRINYFKLLEYYCIQYEALAANTDIKLKNISYLSNMLMILLEVLCLKEYSIDINFFKRGAQIELYLNLDNKTNLPIYRNDNFYAMTDRENYSQRILAYYIHNIAFISINYQKTYNYIFDDYRVDNRKVRILLFNNRFFNSTDNDFEKYYSYNNYDDIMIELNYYHNYNIHHIMSVDCDKNHVIIYNGSNDNDYEVYYDVLM